MTALLPDESDAIAQALRRMLAEQYAFSLGRRACLAVQPALMAPIWDRLVELGLCGLMLDAEHGGVDGDVSDMQRVQHELGRALVVSPWLQTLLCAQLIRIAGSADQQDRWLPGLAQDGQSMAWVDLAASGGSCAAAPDDGMWSLNGYHATVPHACVAGHLVVTVETGSESACFVLETAQAGVSCSPVRLMDGCWAAEVCLRDARAYRLGSRDARHLIGRVRALAVAGLCAEACGMAESALEMSVQHLRVRHQFGQPLAEYQALRHRVADMWIALEQSRSACVLAQEAVMDENAAARSRLCAQAQLVAYESVTWLLQQAIQLHGGMGMTDEVAVGHYYRRMLVINALTGGAPGALRALVREQYSGAAAY